jgi:hypothetical protein
MNHNLLYAEITEKVIGCAMRVHSTLAWVFRKLFIKEVCLLNLKITDCISNQKLKKTSITRIGLLVKGGLI